jgi:drug/metabolite transporter (DMT)-like permease
MIRAVGRAFAGQGELTERQGSILLAASGAAFSVTAIVFRGVESATDFQFLAYRGLSTVAAMALLIFVRRRGRPVSFSGVNGRTWLASAMLASTSMLYILALARTSAATTLFLLAAGPVFAALMGWLLIGERVTRDTVIAIGITAAGIAIMVGAGLEGGSAIGLLLAGMIPVTIGAYNVLMRTMPAIDPVVPSLFSALILAVGTGTVAFARTGLSVSWRDLGLASISGGFALGVGLPLYNLGHRSVPAARVPILNMTEVVLAPLWVWIWPGETPSPATLVGGAVIMGSVVWLMLRSATAHRRPVAVPV